MDESLKGGACLGTLEKNVSSNNVGVCKGKRVSKRVVNMCLSGKVKDCIDFLFSQDKSDKISSGNVTLDELVIGQSIQLVKILEARAVIQTIVHKNIVLRVLIT